MSDTESRKWLRIILSSDSFLLTFNIKLLKTSKLTIDVILAVYLNTSQYFNVCCLIFRFETLQWPTTCIKTLFIKIIGEEIVCGWALKSSLSILFAGSSAAVLWSAKLNEKWEANWIAVKFQFLKEKIMGNFQELARFINIEINIKTERSSYTI